MQVVLVRHGHAGTKEGWAGEDRLRPLDARGRRQAKHLVGAIAPVRPTRLVSSPYDRCLQTMEPLATKLGLPVELDPILTPNATEGALHVVRAISAPGTSGRVVLCTHGEVLGVVLAALAAEDGVRLGRRPPGLKGCAWVIDFRKGRASSARYIAPGR